jgi:hypothetical protein
MPGAVNTRRLSPAPAAGCHSILYVKKPTAMMRFMPGQRNAALRQYRECVRIMEQEIGVPPLDETTQLFQQILENQLALPPPAQEPKLADALSEETASQAAGLTPFTSLEGSMPGFVFR